MSLHKPHFSLIYKGVDISSELDPMTLSIDYTDNGHGEADEISVKVQDKDGRWQGSWKPEPGDLMSLTILDGSGGVLPCGDFEMDEPETSGSRSGDEMTIRGLAAPITKALRTENTKAFEDKNLSAIVREVLSQNGLSHEGQVDDLMFKRVTQRRERDLEFLKRLAEDTGHYFTVKGTRGVFTSIKSIDGQPHALTVFRGDRSLLDYSLKHVTAETYSKAKVSYLDQDKKETTRHEEADAKIKTGDVLKIAGERVESASHAKALAKSRLHFKNRNRLSGSISMVGNVRLVAGVTVGLVGFGQYSGKALVKSSTHSMSRSGYTSKGDLVDARG
ncbi:MAG: late control protein D [Hoeflea sp.]|uniref:phage late control D family protein n=1 Tax=Hoeflea sp. TaxID=1940281 RepID=UPI000C1208E7|nr:contractile injection system protein, VgrG/Pvc8 family [Hoeflea sp.]PHR19300.1 MAG: late control protein D [Hoeflea sp.]